MAKKLTVTNLKKELKNRSQEELIALIANVYKNSDEAVKILNSEIQGRPYTMELLITYKQKLEKIFFPVRLTRMPTANAKKVLAEFDKYCSDKEMQLELKIFFIECCVKFIQDWGEIGFSLVDMMRTAFLKAAEILNELDLEELFGRYESRMRKIVEEAEGFSRVFGEVMLEILHSIKWIRLKDAEGKE